MIKCRYPIVLGKETVNVDGYKWGADSLVAIRRDGNVGPWCVTFLPTGTTINSLFETERYFSPVWLLARIERLELAEPIAWACLSGLPFGSENLRDIEAMSWALAAILDAAAQP